MRRLSSFSHMRMMHQVDSRKEIFLKHKKKGTNNKRRAVNLPFQVDRSIYSFAKPKNARSLAVEDNARYENASVYVVKMPVHYAVHSYRIFRNDPLGIVGKFVSRGWCVYDIGRDVDAFFLFSSFR